MAMADLFSACESGDIDAVRAQLDRGVDPSLRWDDPSRAFRHGKSALMWATRFGHLEIVDLLIQRGADIHFVHKLVGNVLHYAAFHGQTKIGALLISHGLHVDSRDLMWHRTPLNVAASHLKHEFARMLIGAGADVNAVDLAGITPLDCASLYQDTTTADLIRQSGGKHGRFGDETNAMGAASEDQEPTNHR